MVGCKFFIYVHFSFKKLIGFHFHIHKFCCHLILIRYRVYPEPWQVVLQTPVDKKGSMQVENEVVWTSDKRPDYNLAVAKLLAASK